MMRRALGVLAGLAAAGGAAAALWLHWPAAPKPARFAHDQCRRVALTDVGTGRPVVGVEDMALARGGALWLSAQDRLAAERGDGPAPEGGIYRMGLGALSEPGPIALARQGLRTPAVHPHGLDATPHRTAAVLRLYRAGVAEGHAIGLLTRGGSRLIAGAATGRPLCAANDVALGRDRLWVSLDRADCPGMSWRERVWPRPSGRVIEVRSPGGAAAPGAELGGLVHANGLVRLPGAPQRLAVAETRARRIALVDWPEETGEGAPAIARRLALPGAPDNLSVAADGRIVAAVVPSLLRFALYRFGWRDRAPSRAVAVDPGTGAVEMLYDDPAGALFSGATVALWQGGRLVLGSARDAGLLVCEEGT